MRHALTILALVCVASIAQAQAPLRTLYVDHDSRGGTCSDTAYTSAQNAAASPAGSKPFCTLGKMAKSVLAGDLVYVRGGTYSEAETCIGGWESTYTTGCSSNAVLELVKKGTAAHPITIQAYPGEQPIIDPNGQIPFHSCSNNAGLHCYVDTDCPGGTCGGFNQGVTFGLVNANNPVGICTAGSRVGLDCKVDGDCTGGGAGSCDLALDFYTTIDGFKFQNWSFYDSRAAATSTQTGHVWSQYGVQFRNQGTGPTTDVTIQHCEFTHNSGAGALHAYGTARVTFQYNHVHDNRSHGWSTSLDMWMSRGAVEGQNVIRGNLIHDNEDDPPTWCLAYYCDVAAGQPTPTPVTTPGAQPTPVPRCEWNKFENIGITDQQGYGCPCGNASTGPLSGICASGVCSASPNGTDDCTGDTEGHGIIVDSPNGLCIPAPLATTPCTFTQDGACATGCTGVGAPYACCTGNAAGNCCQMGAANSTLIESNIVYNNEGQCISCFHAYNCTVRNNTCYHNGIRPTASGHAGVQEFFEFSGYSGYWNNIIVPRTGPNGIGGTETHVGMGIYYGSGSNYPTDPAHLTENNDLVYSPDDAGLFIWDGGTLGTLGNWRTATGWGASTLAVDPLFVNPSTGNFQLQPSSPAIGAADPSHLAPLDATGFAFITHDMGALAASGPTFTPANTPTITASPTATPTRTVTPTITATPTVTLTATFTPAVRIAPTIIPPATPLTWFFGQIPDHCEVSVNGVPSPTWPIAEITVLPTRTPPFQMAHDFSANPGDVIGLECCNDPPTPTSTRTSIPRAPDTETPTDTPTATETPTITETPGPNYEPQNEPNPATPTLTGTATETGTVTTTPTDTATPTQTPLETSTITPTITPTWVPMGYGDCCQLGVTGCTDGPGLCDFPNDIQHNSACDPSIPRCIAGAVSSNIGSLFAVQQQQVILTATPTETPSPTATPTLPSCCSCPDGSCSMPPCGQGCTQVSGSVCS